MWFLKRSLLFVLIVSLCLFTFGCDDDDDNNDSSDDTAAEESNDLLDGDYLMVLFADSYNQSEDLTFDGAGNYECTIVYDSSGDTGDFSGTYTVETDGEMALAETDSVGAVTADGSSFSLIDTVASGGVDDDIYLGIGIEKPTAADASLLDGDYVVCQIKNDDEYGYMTAYFEFTFDGEGNFTGTIVYETDSEGGDELSGTYTVAADGTIGIDVTGLDDEISGQVSADGNLLALYDSDGNNEEIVFMAGLKTTSGADASLLSGEFYLSMFQGDPDDGPITILNDVECDGEGNITATQIDDSSEDIDTTEYDLTYTVADDGAMTLPEMGHFGIASPDGEMFIIVNTGDDDGDVEVGIGIKKS